MRHLFWIWYLASKSIYWKHAIGVIVFKDAQHIFDSLSVVIRLSLRVQVMQRLKFILSSIRQSKVNGHMNTNLTASHNVVQEGNSFINLKFWKQKSSTSAKWCLVGRTRVYKFVKGYFYLSNLLMIAIVFIVEYLEHYRLAVDGITQLVSIYNNHIKVHLLVCWWLSLWFVNWLVFYLIL